MGKSSTLLLVTLSPLSVLLPEQARAAAGQLLRWKEDADQDGYLLLKSVFVLTGTDSVSSRPSGPWPGHSSSVCTGMSQYRAVAMSSASFFP